MKRIRAVALAASLFAAWACPGPAAAKTPKSHGVYQYVEHLPPGGLADAAAKVREGLAKAGWNVLAEVESGAPHGCPYGARVVVAYNAALGAQVLGLDPATGPYAAVDRVALFEDENGVHVSVVNPESIDRTVLLDEARAEELSARRLRGLREAIEHAVPGRADSADYGEVRDRGLIGKTMGVMAGGPFSGKLEDLAVAPGADVRAVAAKLRAALGARGPKWGLHLAYELELPEAGAVLFGVTGVALEAKSFEIVGAGADGSRGDLKCPGLAHAGAYPLEVVVRKEGDAVHIQVVDAMFRMKMYFEDAGKWAFMKNMGMPGSIADEMRAQVRAAVGEAR